MASKPLKPERKTRTDAQRNRERKHIKLPYVECQQHLLIHEAIPRSITLSSPELLDTADAANDLRHN